MDAQPSASANLGDLKDVIRDILESNGTLNHVKARLRAEVFAALQDDEQTRPVPPAENGLINELIREYLEYNGLFHTLDVLCCEAGMPRQALDRAFVQSQLSTKSGGLGTKMPLLYTLVQPAAAQPPSPLPGSILLASDDGATSARVAALSFSK